jgi:hypothetical protein
MFRDPLTWLWALVNIAACDSDDHGMDVRPAGPK